MDKLVNKLELDPETSMPKLAQIRRHGALKHLVGLKDDTKMRKDNWRDLMYENIKGDDGLQERFLRLLTDGKAIDPVRCTVHCILSLVKVSFDHPILTV